MQIVIVLYDRFTALDAVGPYQVFSSLRGAQVVFAAEQAGRVSDDERSLDLSAEAALADVPRPEIAVVRRGWSSPATMRSGSATTSGACACPPRPLSPTSLARTSWSSPAAPGSTT